MKAYRIKLLILTIITFFNVNHYNIPTLLFEVFLRSNDPKLIGVNKNGP